MEEAALTVNAFLRGGNPGLYRLAQVYKNIQKHYTLDDEGWSRTIEAATRSGVDPDVAKVVLDSRGDLRKLGIGEDEFGTYYG